MVKRIPLDCWAYGRLSCVAPSGSCQRSGETGDTSLALPAPAGPATQSMRPCLSLSSTKSRLLASKLPSSAVSPRCQAVGWSGSGAGRLLSVDLAAREGGVGVLCQLRSAGQSRGLCIPAGSLGCPLRLSQLVLGCFEPLSTLHVSGTPGEGTTAFLLEV